MLWWVDVFHKVPFYVHQAQEISLQDTSCHVCGAIGWTSYKKCSSTSPVIFFVGQARQHTNWDIAISVQAKSKNQRLRRKEKQKIDSERTEEPRRK